MSAPSESFHSFELPIDFRKLRDLPEQEVCVISVFGKTGSRERREAIVNQFLGREGFSFSYGTAVCNAPSLYWTMHIMLSYYDI